MSVFSSSREHASIPGSHAHPHQMPLFSGIARRSVADIAVDVQLRGLDVPEVTKTVADVYCPEVRRSPFSKDLHVNHLDVVSCWKGLSLSQAAEIPVWERLHRAALESQIADLCRRVIASADKSSAMFRLADRLPEGCTHLLDVDVWRLVRDMVNLYYREHKPSLWFAGEGDLAAMVFNFCRTRDCYLETTEGPVLEAVLKYACTSSRIQVVVDVHWQPPNIKFMLPIKLQPGADYCIVPEYNATGLDSGLDPLSLHFSTTIDFLVESKSLALQWDPEVAGFRATMPSVPIDSSGPSSHLHGVNNESASYRDFMLGLHGVGEATRTSMETTFIAKVVISFPGTVRHERTTRYIIRLDVSVPERCRSVEHTLPAMTSSIPDCFSTPSPARGMSPHDSMFSPSTGSACVSSRKHFASDSCEGTSRKRKASNRIPQSSMFDQTAALGNRLALDKLEHVDLELALEALPKRQKRCESAEQDSRVFTADSHRFKIGPAEEYNSEGGDGDVWYHNALGDITTTCLGTAFSHAPLAAKPPGWCKEALKDNDLLPLSCEPQAPKAGPSQDSKPLPSPKRKGPIRRIIFPHQQRRIPRSKYLAPRNTPSSSSGSDYRPDSNCSPSQATIQNNYSEFLRRSVAGADARQRECDAIDDVKAFESIFIEDCLTEGWSTEAEDVSAELEGLVAVEA